MSFLGLLPFFGGVTRLDLLVFIPGIALPGGINTGCVNNSLSVSNQMCIFQHLAKADEKVLHLASFG